MFAVKGMLTAVPAQIVDVLALVIVGAGFTVIVTVCGVPAQLPNVDVGVTVYTTVCTLVVVLMIVLLRVPVDCAVRLSPVVFGLSAAIQL